MQLNLSRLTRTMAIALVSSLASVGLTDGGKEWSATGHLDIYSLFDFGNPGIRQDLAFRQFDLRHNSLSFAVAQINLRKNATEKSPFSAVLSLTAGKNGEVIHAAEPGDMETYRHIQEAYLSYTIPGSRPITVDLGKFLTPVGYESVVSPNNDHYSRGFLFYFGQPIYHAGVRVSAPLSSTVAASVAVVNGWNEAEDSNANKSLIFTLAATLTPALSATVNYYTGNEGSADTNGAGLPDEKGVRLLDTSVVYQATPKLKFGVNATVIDFDDTESADIDTSDLASGEASFQGLAVYGKLQLTEKASAGLRIESVDDKDGLRSGSESRYSSITGTLDYALVKDVLLRLEFRSDRSNREAFSSDDGLKKNRSTLTFGASFKF